jgi:hypothetical protein
MALQGAMIMALTANEAMVVFGRKAETIMEIADGVRMGVQLVQGLNQRCAQLEQYIQQNGLAVPPPLGEPMPAPANQVPLRPNQG